MRTPLMHVAVWIIALSGTLRAEDRPETRFNLEGVLGTSFEMIVRAEPAQAERARQAALGEIDRLGGILSTYQPDSAASRLNASSGAVACPAELVEVLRAYEAWTKRSGGAYSAQVGGLVTLWRQAEKAQSMPAEAELAAAVHDAAAPAFRIDGDSAVTRLSSRPLNLDSLGKGYIIEKAMAAAQKAAPEAHGILINIGGDIRAFDRNGQGWTIGVADPGHFQDNARPLTRIVLSDHAIATSAAYERGYRIAGRRYSHILDPRTGMPARGVASATVIAADNVTANALATTLCVVGVEEGLRLVATTPGAACLIVDESGAEHRSGGFVAMESPLPPANPAELAADGWPAGFEVGVSLMIKPARGRKQHRPYVAAWVTDAQGKTVRTITVWGNERKYLRDLPEWWKIGSKEPRLVSSVTRATRPAGRYRLAWDGKDDAGNPVGRGTYTIHLESNREKGTHCYQATKIECSADKSTAVITGTVEFEQADVTYGPPQEP